MIHSLPDPIGHVPKRCLSRSFRELPTEDFAFFTSAGRTAILRPTVGGRRRTHELGERSSHALLARFEAWGATEDELSAADDLIGWLPSEDAGDLSVRDVIEYLWDHVPSAFEAPADILEDLRRGVARLLEFLAAEGVEVSAAREVARDGATFRERVASRRLADQAEWIAWSERRLHDTGMEPFPWLPDGFRWSSRPGPDEQHAYFHLRGWLTSRVRAHAISPGTRGWRSGSARQQMGWLDQPHPCFFGGTPRQAIDAEREEPWEADEDESDAPEEPFPPIRLPSEETLAMTAARSDPLTWMRALLEILAEGRPLTSKRNLRLEDGLALGRALGTAPDAGQRRPRSVLDVPGVDLAFRWARAAGFVKVRRGQAEPTARARRLGERPLDDWWALFASFVWKLRWPVARWGRGRAVFWAEDLADLIPRYLEEIYRERGHPLEVASLVETTAEALLLTYGHVSVADPAGVRRLVEADIVHGILRPLTDLGALGLDGPFDDLRVSATELGLWATRRLIPMRWGATPPLVGDLGRAAVDGEALVAAVQTQALGPDDLREEVRAYRERRGPAAASELAALLTRAGPETLALLACLEALDPAEVTPHVTEVARTSASGAARAQCVLWLEERGIDAPGVEFTREDLAECIAWPLVGLSRADGPEAVPLALGGLGGEASQVDLLETLARSDGPAAREVLEAVAAGPASKAVRKAARRGLHRLRSRPEGNGGASRTSGSAKREAGRRPGKAGQAYELKVVLRGTEPPVWRRLRVPGDLTLARLHQVLQVAMGWRDYHLYEFQTGDAVFGSPHPELEGVRDAAAVRLGSVVPAAGGSVLYRYDFGDNWEHDITVEAVLPIETPERAPHCLGGARACPPEDCGGVHGYREMLEALDDPAHERHAEMAEWAGDFDPGAFDPGAVNEPLAGLGPRRRHTRKRR